MDAVGAHQQIALDLFSAGQVKRGTTIGGIESGGLGPERDHVRTDGVEKRSVQRRSQRHHQWSTQHLARGDGGTLEHGAVHAAHLAADESRCVSAREHDVGHSELRECGDRVRRERHAKSELTRRRGAFEDADPPACLPQGNRCGEPANSGADDQGGAQIRNQDSVNRKQGWARHQGSGIRDQGQGSRVRGQDQQADHTY